MAVSSMADFWKLAVESRLFTVAQCQQAHAQFEQASRSAGQGGSATGPKALADWLVQSGALSRYQANILLAGRPGPFVYGEYQVVERIESGRWKGFFRAVHLSSKHPVWLQFVAGETAQDPNAWNYISSFVRMGLSPPHLHIHRCHEAVDLGRYRFLVFEQLSGDTVEELLSQSGRLPPAVACQVTRQVALALTQLHRLGMAHGDIRPSNFWVEPLGRVVLLCDPTRPRVAWNQPTDEPQSSLLERANYAAPEFTIAGKQPDALTDIYALGCSLYQMLAGQPPFAGGDVATKFQRHTTEAIQPLEPLGVAPALAQAVAYMMAKNPGVRYQSAVALVQQLTSWLDPASLPVAGEPALATLTQYERELQQRVTPAAAGPPAVSPPVPATAPLVAPASAPPVASASPPIGSHAAPEPPPSSASAVPEVAPVTRRSTTVKRPASKSKQSTYWIIGGCLGALAIAVIVLLNASPNDTKTKKEPESLVSAPPTAGKASFVNGAGTTGSGNAKANTTSGDPSKADVVADANTADKGKTPRPAGRGVKPADNDDAPTAADPPTRPQQIVNDDGKMLWASPTSGKPVDFRLVPPGGQVFLMVRPADLLASAEGPRVVRALGPVFEAARRAWEEACGTRLEEVEQLIVALHDNGEEFPRPSFVVHLKEEIEKTQLLERFKNPEATDEKMPEVYRGKGWAFFLPADGDGRTFTMGSPEEIEKVALETKGAAPALRREIERLRRMSDDQRHVSLLLAPNYLASTMFRDGRTFYFGEAKKLREPVDWLLKDELQAVLFSLHCGDGAYLELRLSSNLNKEKSQLATELKDRLAQVPDFILDYIATLGSNPYWERVRLLYPNMIRSLHKMTRVGVEEEVAVVNCVLPGSAAHNLVFGSEMVLASTPGAAPPPSTTAANTGGPAKPSPAGMTFDDVLNKYETNIMFEAQSLEFALQDIAKDVNESLRGLPFEFKIKIMGEDLQLDGITRNQSVRDFNQRGKSVADILTAMVRKANPITTVKDASEKDQKLIWVVEKDPDDPNKSVVLVTTRAAAEKRKYQLPKPFQLK